MWDCDMVFLVPESNFASVTFKVFDKDTIGKDKSLGMFSTHNFFLKLRITIIDSTILLLLLTFIGKLLNLYIYIYTNKKTF